MQVGFLRRALEVCSEIEERTGRAPRPYQLEAIAWALRGNCLLALDMGLGKTYCALMAWLALRPAITAIVCPASVKGVWVDELNYLFGKVEVLELLGATKLRARLLSVEHRVAEYDFSSKELNSQEAQIYLLSHEAVTAYGPIIHAKATRTLLPSSVKPSLAMAASGILEPPDMVIVDESHLFGGWKSKRTKALYGLTSRARRVVLLTGTPLAGGVQRLYPQLQLVAPNRWGKYWDFVVRYAGGEEGDFGGITPTRATNIDELKSRTEDLILSLKKEKVSADLPKHIRQRVPVFLTKHAYDKCQEEVAGFSKILRERGGAITDRFLQGEVTRIMGKLAKYKLASLSDLLKSTLREERVLVWCWHRRVAQLVTEKACHSRPAFKVDGSLSEAESNWLVQRWGHTSNGVLTATIAKLGTGYDVLAKYSKEQIVLEIPWLPEILEQALARLVRLSQPETVVTTRLLQLQIPFEKSLCDRILSRSMETDLMLEQSTLVSQVEELFGEVSYSPDVLEKILVGVMGQHGADGPADIPEDRTRND